MLPPLHRLSLTTVGSGLKRRRGRDDSVPLGTQDERLQLDWRSDKRNWKEVVCRVWDGRPLVVASFSFQKEAPYMSPEGDWKNRELVASSKVQTGASGVASCTVLQNIHDFDPTGMHNMDMELLHKKLDVHYPATPTDAVGGEGKVAARTFAFSSLPASYATRYDIQTWVEGLSRKGFVPWWINDDAFEGWKESVMSTSYAYEVVAKTTEDAGCVRFIRTQQIYTFRLFTSHTFPESYRDLSVRTDFGISQTAASWRGTP